MKNLTKKERFEKVLAELKALEGLDVIVSYYYDHEKLYANQKDCKIDFNFLDLSIVLVNPIAIGGVEREEIIEDYETLRDAFVYSAICGEIGYYFNNPVILVHTNKYTSKETVKQVKAIYDAYFKKQGDVAYMEVCDMFNLNMLGDVTDNDVIFEEEFKLRNDLDFLDYKIVDNYGEPYMRKKLIRDVATQVYNYITGPEAPSDSFIDTLADEGTQAFAVEIAQIVHKEMGSNILDDKIYNEFIVNKDFVPVDPVTKYAKAE